MAGKATRPFRRRRPVPTGNTLQTPPTTLVIQEISVFTKCSMGVKDLTPKNFSVLAASASGVDE